MKEKAKVSILVLDFMRPVESELCLQSLKQNLKFKAPIIYLSNGGDQDYVWDFYKNGLIDKLILNKENTGLGFGTTDLFKICDTEYAIYVQCDQFLGREYTEEELIALVRQKNQKAFSYLYDNYSKAMYGVIYNIVQNENDAEDILQTAFLKIWNNFSAYKEEKGRLFTWMLNLVRNTTIDFTRTTASKISSKIQAIDHNVYEINKHHQQKANYDHIGLKAAVNNLDEEHQAIIELAYYEGYTQEEIAAKLNMPLGTVKTKVRQAIIHLRNKIVQ